MVRNMDKLRCILGMVVVFMCLFLLLNKQFYSENIIENSIELQEISLKLSSSQDLQSCPTKCTKRKVKGRFYSQSGEDNAVFTKYFLDPSVCNETYLEIGALDGVRYSNSKFFEDSLGWSGVLIEAQPNNYKNLKKNRPNSKTFGVAICPETQKTIKFAGDGAIGGVVDAMSENHKKGYDINSKSKIIEVPCRTMSSILKEADIDKIDFFTLDVEGAELKVLETMDWDVPVRVFVVELAGEDRVKDEAVRNILREHGYVEADFNIRKFCRPGGDCAANEVWENRNQDQFKCN